MYKLHIIRSLYEKGCINFKNNIDKQRIFSYTLQD